MNTRTKLLLALAALLTAFAFGRFTAPEKVKIETRTVEVEKKTENTDTNRDKHQDTVTTTEKKPDGTVITRTETVVDTKTDRKTAETDNTTTKTDTTKEITRSSSPVTLSVLGGVNITSFSSSPIIYGGSVTRPILGPITVGIFGLSNGVAGASIGLTF